MTQERRLMTLIASMALLVLVSITALPAQGRDPTELLAGTSLAVVLAVLVGWRSVPSWLAPVRRLVPFALFVVIAILRQGTGGSTSGLAVLVLFPVLWLSLYESPFQWIIGTICAGLVVVVPILVVGGSRYPAADWRRALLLTTFSAVLGLTVSRWRGAHQQATTDRLTGIANRRLWEEVLPRMVAQARREEKPLSVAVLDFDHFKSVNDTLGHQAGDRVLRQAASAWSSQLREGDLLARYGGEEFAIALYDCPTEEAVEVLERVRACTPDGQTCSVGIATLTGGEDADELVSRADAALYEAKRCRDRTVVQP